MNAAADLLLTGTGAGTGGGTNPAPVPKPRKPRGPSKKMRAALAAEYERGKRDGADAATEGQGIVFAIVCCAFAVVGFGLGAAIF